MNVTVQPATTQPDPADTDEGRYGRLARRFAPDVAAVGLALIGGGLVVTALEHVAGFDNGSPAFLLAVVAVAVARGTGPAIATAIGAFLAYDFFFTAPHLTFTISDPAEWLNVLLLLVVGIVVGRLAGRERDRAVSATAGEREARALFKVSFSLANQRDTAQALAPIVLMLRDEIRMTRVWVLVGDAVAADTGAPGAALTPPSSAAVHASLRRRPGDDPAEWVRVHAPNRIVRTGSVPSEATYKVAITAGGRTLGSLWAGRMRSVGDPDAGETRVMAAAADQIGASLERDRLLRDATSAEISRRSDALKSALLDAVSHDLRTPLASIRAAAGTLMDPDVDWPVEQRREIAASVDREADWLNRLVTNLLDMSRIDAGELTPNLATFELRDLVDDVVRRTMAERAVSVEIPVDLPLVEVDEVFLVQILANILDNAAKYAGADAPISMTATVDDGRVRLAIEDGGPGVPADALPRLFEKFYRVPRRGEGSRRGTGIGLSVVRGLAEAMGATVVARPSAFGGLAVDLWLPTVARNVQTQAS